MSNAGSTLARMELAETTDGNGNPVDDEAAIFLIGHDSAEITISAPNAAQIAERIVQLWNAGQ